MKTPKIVIENLVVRLAGGEESELNGDIRIRFDYKNDPNGNYSITIGFDRETGGIGIYKSNGFNDMLQISPLASNRIIVK